MAQLLKKWVDKQGRSLVKIRITDRELYSCHNMEVHKIAREYGISTVLNWSYSQWHQLLDIVGETDTKQWPPPPGEAQKKQTRLFDFSRRQHG